MIEEFRNMETVLGEQNLLERSIVIDSNQVTHDKLREAGVRRCRLRVFSANGRCNASHARRNGHPKRSG